MRRATKAAGNIYYQARIMNAEYNERLTSREGAAEDLGIEKSRLARIELDSLDPYPEEVIMMAEVYKAPELCHYFCQNQCMLGSHTVPVVEMAQLDRLALKVLSSFRDVDGVRNTIIDICADGMISEDEEPQLDKVLVELDAMVQVAQSLKLWAEKYMK